jgi:hypothetical protein
MYNYIKCKYKINISESDKVSLGSDMTKLTFLCEPIKAKVGEFLIRSNGELCHNITEYELVEVDQMGTPGVIWNGTGYARIKSTNWVRIDYDGSVQIETQIISKKTDANLKVEFEFVKGYVVSHKPVLLLIDNTERLAHDTKIKKFAINHAKKLNSTAYKLQSKLIRQPLIGILHGLGYVGSYLQDVSWKLERKLNK